jgi:hypothetical protein
MWFGPTGSYDPAYAFFRFSGHDEQDRHPFVKAQFIDLFPQRLYALFGLLRRGLTEDLF